MHELTVQPFSRFSRHAMREIRDQTDWPCLPLDGSPAIL
eukprot:COSAG01_NODE_337_length_18678_cov_21.905969_4_plen_39_part_00